MTAITAFFMVFRRLPSTFLTFPNVLQTMFEGHTNAAEHFLKNEALSIAARVGITFSECIYFIMQFVGFLEM